MFLQIYYLFYIYVHILLHNLTLSLIISKDFTILKFLKYGKQFLKMRHKCSRQSNYIPEMIDSNVNSFN